MSEKAWIMRDPARSESKGVFLDDGDSVHTRLFLRDYYNTDELRDGLIDRALEKKESLTRLEKTVDSCGWRPATDSEIKYMTANILDRLTINQYVKKIYCLVNGRWESYT